MLIDRDSSNKDDVRPSDDLQDDQAKIKTQKRKTKEETQICSKPQMRVGNSIHWRMNVKPLKPPAPHLFYERMNDYR